MSGGTPANEQSLLERLEYLSAQRASLSALYEECVKRRGEPPPLDENTWNLWNLVNPKDDAYNELVKMDAQFLGHSSMKGIMHARLWHTAGGIGNTCVVRPLLRMHSPTTCVRIS